MDYRIEKRTERVEAVYGDRQLIRVTLTPCVTNNEMPNVVVTVEELPGADGRVRPVMPLSIVAEDTYEVVHLDRKNIELAVTTAAQEFAEEDESLLDNTPAW